MLENGQMKLRLGPELARMLNLLAARAGLTPESWLRSAIVAHGGNLASKAPSSPKAVSDVRRVESVEKSPHSGSGEDTSGEYED